MGLSSLLSSPPWVKKLLKPLRGHRRDLLAISFFVNILALTVPIFTLQVYDRVVGHNATSTLLALVIGVSLALSFDWLLRLARGRTLQHMALHIDAKLGKAVYDKLACLPLRVLESKPAQHWQSLFQDAATVRQIYAGPPVVLATDLPFALIFVVVLLVIALPVAWLLLIFIPLFIGISWMSSHVLNKATEKEREQQRSRDMLLSEMMAGRTTLKALDIARAMEPEWEKAQADSIRRSFMRGSLTDRFMASGQSLSMVVSVTLISVGALAIIDREMTMGALIAANMLSGRIVGPFNQLLGNWRSVASGRQAITRLDEFFRLPGERQEATIEREVPKGIIQCDNLSFSYRDEALKPTLEQIACEIQPGGMTGLIGPNGCGKTTLIKLLQGLYTPNEGRVLLDGQDIAQFSRRELSRWIGYVPQECQLFTGSIRENIARAHPEAEDTMILHAARLAGAEEFISALPDGYATSVGELGGQLSAGQRQRIAVARALLHNPPILILDEMTSNLDMEAEAEMAEVLERLAKVKTIIASTHSLTILRRCNRIMALKGGRIAVYGPAQQVLEHLGIAAPAASASAPKTAEKPNGQATASTAKRSVSLSSAPRRPQPPEMRPAG